jgi:O-antigen/teichoic acid export membrane protein
VVVSQMVFIGAGALALWLGWGYLGLIGANLLAIAVSTLIVVRAVTSIGWGALQPARWTGLIRASLPFGIVTFALGLSYKFDTVLLELTRPPGETGLYNAAYNLVFTCVVLSNILNTALYPALSRLSITAPERLPAIYARALRYLWLAALPLAVGGAVLAGDLVPFLFDSDYAAGAAALRIVIWVVPLMYTSEFLGYAVLIDNQERRVARAVVISTALNVLLNLAIVPIFGFVAAAVTTVVTEAVLVGQYAWLLRGRLRALPLGQILVRPMLAAIGMGALVAWLPGDWVVWTRVLAGGVAYGALSVAMGLLTRSDLTFLRDMRRAAPTASEAPPPA